MALLLGELVLTSPYTTCPRSDFREQVGFLGWTWDAFDFFTVSLTIADLSKDFKKTPADITWGITLALMFRSVGAIIFGIASDRYGRKVSELRRFLYLGWNSETDSFTVAFCGQQHPLHRSRTCHRIL